MGEAKGSSYNPMDIYIKEISRFELLTPEREVELSEIIQGSYQGMKDCILGSYAGASLFLGMYNSGDFSKQNKDFERNMGGILGDVEEKINLIGQTPVGEETKGLEEKLARGFDSVKIKDSIIYPIIEEIKENDTLLRYISNEKLEEFGRLDAKYEVAVEEFVNANLRLVVHELKLWKNAKSHFFDFVQEGNKGLIDAVKDYDFKKGAKFSHYALGTLNRPGRVRANIRRYAANNKLIRFSHRVLEDMAKLRKASEFITDPEDYIGLSQKSKLSVERIKEIEGFKYTITSLNYVPDDDNKEVQIKDNKSPDPSKGIADSDSADRIIQYMSNIVGEKRARFVAYRYGFIDGEEHELSETADYFGENTTHQYINNEITLAIKMFKKRPAFMLLLKNSFLNIQGEDDGIE